MPLPYRLPPILSPGPGGAYQQGSVPITFLVDDERGNVPRGGGPLHVLGGIVASGYRRFPAAFRAAFRSFYPLRRSQGGPLGDVDSQNGTVAAHGPNRAKPPSIFWRGSVL